MQNTRSAANSGTPLILPGSAAPEYPQRTPDILGLRHSLVTSGMINDALSLVTDFRPEDISPAVKGKGSCSYIAGNDRGDRLVLKIGMFGDHHGPADEYLFNTLLKTYARNIPVPEILVLDLSGERMPWPYIIHRWLPGESIIDLAAAGRLPDIPCIFGAVGQCLRELHAVPVSTRGFGPPAPETIETLVDSGDVPDFLQGRFENTDQYCLEPSAEAAQFLLAEGVLDKNDYEKITSLLDKGIPENDTPVLLHGDVSMGNFLVHDSRLGGILDGAAVIGPPMVEAASAVTFIRALGYHFPGFPSEAAVDSFFSGYGSDRGTMERDEQFRFFMMTGLLRHMALLVENSRTKHVDKYREEMRHYY